MPLLRYRCCACIHFRYVAEFLRYDAHRYVDAIRCSHLLITCVAMFYDFTTPTLIRIATLRLLRCRCTLRYTFVVTALRYVILRVLHVTLLGDRCCHARHARLLSAF